MKTPPLRFTMTLDPPESEALSEAQAILHRITGKPHSRAAAIREMLRRFVTDNKINTEHTVK